VEEFAQREARGRNVIMFGLVETLDPNRDVMKARDIEKIANLVKLVSPDVSCPLIFRLGKHSQGRTAPRPVKLVFRDTNLAQAFRRDFVRKKKDVSGPPELRGILAVPDRTPYQTRIYK